MTIRFIQWIMPRHKLNQFSYRLLLIFQTCFCISHATTTVTVLVPLVCFSFHSSSSLSLFVDFWKHVKFPHDTIVQNISKKKLIDLLKKVNRHFNRTTQTHVWANTCVHKYTSTPTLGFQWANSIFIMKFNVYSACVLSTFYLRKMIDISNWNVLKNRSTVFKNVC